MPYIQFLGAAGTVTGSKHLISTAPPGGAKGFQALIDCGLFQGQKEWRERNWQDTPIPAREIDAVILTHAHLDHSGWIPRLIQEGFSGPIYATPPTLDLCRILLPDSGHLQEEEADFHNKHKSSKHEPALPLYTREQAEKSLERFQPVGFGEMKTLAPGLSFRYHRAAHILGSAMVEVTMQSPKGARKLLFTGDVGRVRNSEVAPGKVVVAGPETVENADLMVMESTYGNRLHPTSDPRPELAKLVRTAVGRGGTVVVPAFAVERTQKFLFMLKELMEAGDIPRVPVHTDSPMAIQAVEVFLKYSEEFSPQTKELVARFGSPLEWQGFHFDRTVEESKKLNDSAYPAVILSSSGMATGGRILHHLMHRLPDPKNLVVFIGFQAPGTRGAIIKGGAATVRIFSEDVPIRAQVAALEQFSDHADPPELLEWLRTFKKAPQVAYLVHGEPAAASRMRLAMTSALGWKVEVAEWMQKVEVR
jgi:metallo-beta-lactamase family protein